MWSEALMYRPSGLAYIPDIARFTFNYINNWGGLAGYFVFRLTDFTKMWSVINLEEVMKGQVLHDFSLQGEHPNWFWFGGLSSFRVWLFMYLRNLIEYPLNLRALNRVVQASSKSYLLLQILWNLIICDYMIPLKCVWGGKNFYVTVGVNLWV